MLTGVICHFILDINTLKLVCTDWMLRDNCNRHLSWENSYSRHTEEDSLLTRSQWNN